MTLIELTTLLDLAKKASKGKFHIGHINEHDDRCDVEDETFILIGEDMQTKDALYLCAAAPDVIISLIEQHFKMKQALEFYANMDNHVPGMSKWDDEVVKTLTGTTGATMHAWDQPSHYQKDMGNRARQALDKSEEG